MFTLPESKITPRLKQIFRLLPFLPVQPVHVYYCDENGFEVSKSERLAVRFAIGYGFIDAVNSLNDPVWIAWRNINSVSRTAKNYQE